MSRYIDVENLEYQSHIVSYQDGNTTDYETEYYLTEADIEAIPSADVVPVRHGKWEITDAYPHNVYCSECHKKFAQTHWEVWEDGSLPRNYCPNCGAKMDGEE